VVLYSRPLTPEEITSLTAATPTITLALFPGITFSGQPGQTYSIQYATNLTQTSWITLTNLTLTQIQQIWVDTSVNAANSPRRFYRAVLVP